eukprot:SAG25_NODE_5457_length_655_cov_1.325540_2_plen_56_part_01
MGGGGGLYLSGSSLLQSERHIDEAHKQHEHHERANLQTSVRRGEVATITVSCGDRV